MCDSRCGFGRLLVPQVLLPTPANRNVGLLYDAFLAESSGEKAKATTGGCKHSLPACVRGSCARKLLLIKFNKGEGQRADGYPYAIRYTVH